MSREMKAGDRVRVTVRKRLGSYQPGDKGTVLRSSLSATAGERYYTVAMDKDDPTASGAILSEGEIEPDV